MVRLVALLLASGPRLPAERVVAGEYEVKAAFLLNFAKFVEWPAQAFTSPSQPIGICVLGQNPFGSSLAEVVEGNQVAGRAFMTRQISEAGEAAGCHIVFLGASERKRLGLLLVQFGQLPLLTVGETDDFLPSGGVVCFKVQGGRVRFEIDEAAAGRAGLRISSKLLSLASSRR
jgi:hypothetical protein